LTLERGIVSLFRTLDGTLLHATLPSQSWIVNVGLVGAHGRNDAWCLAIKNLQFLIL
jgi:hypothetical protein